MHVFVTGASGWIGSAVVDDLLAAGHHVTGLARSDASAAALSDAGAHVRRGDLDDLESLREGAEAAEATIHLANKHDWANPAASNAAERAAVATLVDTLAGSDRRLLVAAGVAGLVTGRPATEADPNPSHGPDAPRGGSENLALAAVERGVHPVSLRFAPTVHGPGDHGFVATLTATARATGVAGHPEGGTNRWAAVARADAARLVGLALEKAPVGAVLHATGEEGVPTRDIAAAIGRCLGVPTAAIPSEDVEHHFGWLGRFVAMDMAASSAATRDLLDWTPTGPSLVEDIDAGGYRHAGAQA